MRAVPPGKPELRLAFAGLAGLFHFGLLLLAGSLFGMPWTFAALAPLCAAGIAVSLLSRPAPSAVPAEPAGTSGPRRWSWGDAVALLALALFAFCTARSWNLFTDFIYHWGIKGKTFALARGVDFHYLSRPWSSQLHPDYPNLLPALFAVTALWEGAFREPVLASWSTVWFALLLIFGRELLWELGVSPFALQAGMAILGLTLAMFGVGYQLAGGADWLIAVALLAGAGALLAPASAAADQRLGIAAAIGAAAKIEGMPLAATLIGLHLFRRARALPGLRPLLGPALRAGLPSLAAVALWAWPTWRFHLFQPQFSGDFRWARLPIVLPELGRTLLTPNWHGLALCLLAVPLLALQRRFRPVALPIALQLGFYLYIYLSARVDPRLYVQTGAARLFFHLVPTALLLLVAWIDGASEGAS